MRAGAAADAIAADYGKATAKWARLEFLSGRVPHEKMPAESGGYAGFKGVSHAGGRLVDSYSIPRRYH
jgi:hypothetical protein